jgi:alpha-tubulin suppressor-like RCC1 family protein
MCGTADATNLSLSGASTENGVSYQWQSSFNAGSYTDIPGAVTPSFQYTPPGTGTYTFRCVVTCANGGASENSTETATLTVNALPTVGATASPSLTVCAGTAVTLSGTGASSYTWTGGVTDGVAFVPTSTADYMVTGTDANGCSGNLQWIKAKGNNSLSLGIRSDGTLWTLATTPQQFIPGANWTSIAEGNFHYLALRSDGTLWASGFNGYGQLGNGSTTSTNLDAPVQVGTETNWSTIASGGHHSLGIKSDGTLWAWGRNAFGQTGNGTNTNSNVPVQVGTGTDWVTIAAGSSHSLGIKSDGTLWAWGYNGTGALGDGTNTNSNIPVQVGTGTDWVSIAGGVGGTHSLAIKSDGTLWAWGSNSEGQLGNGTNDDSNIPVQIGTGTDWIAIAGGGSHSLGIKSDGTLWAWGNNIDGQLGDGTNTGSNVPVQVGTGTNWAATAAGYAYSLGIKSDGNLWAWGNNNFGQLGDGTTTASNIALQVLNPATGTSITVTVNPSQWYLDADNDGYYVGDPVTQCTSPGAGYNATATTPGDCDDSNPNVHPGAAEICGNNIDDNCDGRIDEKCAPVSISINDASVIERNRGSATVTLVVSLNKISNNTVTVDYTTQNLTATAGNDYVSRSGTLSFAPGIRKQNIKITITGDKAIEPDETFNVVLSNPVNGKITRATGTGTILNDDGISLSATGTKLSDDAANSEKSVVKLSPNPASNMVTVELNGYNGEAVIQLLSGEGKLIKQEKIQAFERNTIQKFDVTNLANGVYFVSAINEAGYRRTVKLIVAH